MSHMRYTCITLNKKKFLKFLSYMHYDFGLSPNYTGKFHTPKFNPTGIELMTKLDPYGDRTHDLWTTTRTSVCGDFHDL